MGIERRKNLRLPMLLDVVLKHRAQSVICSVRDISLGGAFVDAEPELLPYAGAVELTLSVPTSGASLRLPATIRRITDKGAAVSFGELGQQTYFQLVDMMTVPTTVGTARSDRAKF